MLAITGFIFSFHLHAESILLAIGETKWLPASASATVRLSSKKFLRIVELENRIGLVGIKVGSTALNVDSKGYQVHVLSSSQLDFFKNLEKALQEMKGLKVEVRGEKITVVGELLRFSDWLEIASISKRLQGEFVFGALPYRGVAKVAISHFQKLAESQGLPLLRYSSEPQLSVWIPKGEKSLKDSADRIFSSFGIAVESSDSSVLVEPQVRTHVILAEVTKSFSRTLGLQWPSEYQAQVIPKLSGVTSVLATLKALEAEGQAQVLAAPNLLCKSGGEAEFHAGGEFPIRTSSRFNTQVAWKKHGVLLKVKPKADFSGAISLSISTEISLLDHANSVEGVPALKVNTVSSHFDLPGRRTIVLSGLLRQDWGSTSEGLPFLSSLPVLGRLFGSKSYQSQQSELVVFVTPEVHSPESDAPIEMPKGWVFDEP